MCRLFGLAGAGITHTDLRIFEDLGTMSQVHGIDGSGVFQTNSRHTGKHSYYDEKLKKDAVDWNYYLYMNRKVFKDRVLDAVNCDYIMGHVRAATSGTMEASSCHPFRHGTIVGAHNGTLKDKKYDDKKRCDSDLMFEDISRRGIADVLRTMDKDSAYAITMYDSVSKNFIFTRNKHRPLCFAVSEERAVLYWASEPGILRACLDRRGQDYKLFNSFRDGSVWITNTKSIKKGGGVDVFTQGPKIYTRQKDADGKETGVVVWWKTDQESVPVAPVSVPTVERKETAKVIHLPAPKTDVPWTPPEPQEKIVWGEHAICAACDKEPLSLLQMYLIKKDPLIGVHGYYDEPFDRYYNYECNHCKEVLATPLNNLKVN